LIAKFNEELLGKEKEAEKENRDAVLVFENKKKHAFRDFEDNKPGSEEDMRKLKDSLI